MFSKHADYFNMNTSVYKLLCAHFLCIQTLSNTLGRLMIIIIINDNNIIIIK